MNIYIFIYINQINVIKGHHAVNTVAEGNLIFCFKYISTQVDIFKNYRR